MDGTNTPYSGGPSPQQQNLVRSIWTQAVKKFGLDDSGIDHNAPLRTRLTQVIRAGLPIGVIYSRFSTKKQGSTDDQIRACVEVAASKGIYVDPELVAIDEAVTGRKSQRVGFEWARELLSETPATVLVTYSTSRLYRRGYMANRFLQEEVVDEGYRAITVAEDLDTDSSDWDFKSGFYAIRDDQAVKSLAKDVRNGQIGLHSNGYATGAIPVGFIGVEDPDAPRTRRNLMRRRLAVDPEQAPIIRRAYERVANGMRIAEAYRLYKAEGGKADPRSTSGIMQPAPFRRLLSRPSYIGVVAYGRKRNRFVAKTDSVVQDIVPEDEIRFYRDEDLRIVTDELFFAVQEKLGKLKSGPRGPRCQADPQLWDLVTECFYCPSCDRRFYVCGAGNTSMHCPNPECATHGIVRRKDAVVAIVEKLERMLQDDKVLQQLVSVVCAERSEAEEEQVKQAIATLSAKINRATARISDLQELAGDGSERDRAETKAKIRAAQADRDALERERAVLSDQAGAAEPITPDQVRKQLADLRELLIDGAAGRLGSERVDEAAEAFKLLVGHRVDVHVLPRPGRDQTVVRGVFKPNLAGIFGRGAEIKQVPAISVWLRRPPQMDQIAALVKHLYSRFNLGYPRAAQALNRAGLAVKKSNVYTSYLRYFEMSGVPKPPSRPPGRQPGEAY